MAEKELRRLKRQELLQLLLAQVKEAEELQEKLHGTESQLKEANEILERLKARLNSKDAQIHKLKGRLDKKDAQIKSLKATEERLRSDRKIRLKQSGSIAEAALRLSGIFEAAQEAADLYLENVRLLHDRPEDGGWEEITIDG